jgi:putative ABC transport system ATP-binding protein
VKALPVLNVELPLIYRGLNAAERKTRVTEALEKVGMSHRPKRRENQLSGGQQQRVPVARALHVNPVVLEAAPSWLRRSGVSVRRRLS